MDHDPALGLINLDVKMILLIDPENALRFCLFLLSWGKHESPSILGSFKL